MKCALTLNINKEGNEVESKLFTDIFNHFNSELRADEDVEKLTKEGYAKFQTQEFKDKFKDSIAVDENNEPLLLYFDREEDGLHYFNTKSDSIMNVPVPVVINIKKALNEPYDETWSAAVLKDKINNSQSDGFLSKSANIYVVPNTSQIVPLERENFDYTREEFLHIMNVFGEYFYFMIC